MDELTEWSRCINCLEKIAEFASPGFFREPVDLLLNFEVSCGRSNFDPCAKCIDCLQDLQGLLNQPPKSRETSCDLSFSGA